MRTVMMGMCRKIWNYGEVRTLFIVYKKALLKWTFFCLKEQSSKPAFRFYLMCLSASVRKVFFTLTPLSSPTYRQWNDHHHLQSSPLTVVWKHLRLEDGGGWTDRENHLNISSSALLTLSVPLPAFESRESVGGRASHSNSQPPTLPPFVPLPNSSFCSRSLRQGLH